VYSLVIDKTGTLTDGRAQVLSVNVRDHFAPDNILRLAASLDQASKHIIAQTLVTEARDRKLHLSTPSNVIETAGEGIEGSIDGLNVLVGGIHFVRSKLTGPAKSSLDQTPKAGAVIVAVAIDGEMAGEIVLADELRAGTQTLLQTLRKLGIKRIILATRRG
jgi:P-type E1-E2 ATPase